MFEQIQIENKNILIKNNTVWHDSLVSRAQRENQHKHKSVIIWFTGLSGSGKSTLAHAVEERLFQAGCKTFVFDGDNVRHGLCCDLDFSEEDRKENIRRIGEMTKLFIDAGVIALTAFISPYNEDRKLVRELVSENDFIEIYCCCPLDVCEQRDVKGLYKKARSGEIENYTGISSPYEEPEQPDLVLHTDSTPLEKCIDKVIDLLAARKVFMLSSTK